MSYRKSELDKKSIKYWLLPEITSLIQQNTIPAYFESHATEIYSGSVKLSKSDGSSVNVLADFVLKAIGFEADMSLCKMAGVELTGQGQVPTLDQATMQTNVSGLYLAGTVTGGTQHRFAVFIENGHVHVDRIVRSICGKTVPGAIALPEKYELEES